MIKQKKLLIFVVSLVVITQTYSMDWSKSQTGGSRSRDYHNTELHNAARFGNLNQIKRNQKAYKSLVMNKNIFDQTALDQALFAQKDEAQIFAVMELILSLATDHEKTELVNNVFNTKNNRMPMLHVALSKGYPQIVKLLLSYGADPCTVNDNEQNSLHIAVHIKDNEKRNTILDLLLGSEYKDKIINKKAKVYKQYTNSYDNPTPLLTSIFYGQIGYSYA